jgi:hypothetical protein
MPYSLWEDEVLEEKIHELKSKFEDAAKKEAEEEE